MPPRVLIVGGGVIGLSIAWHLATRGIARVTLLEKERIGAGTTWHSAGNITWRPLPHHDEGILYAFETIARLEQETRQSTGWLRTGRLFLSRSPRVTGMFEKYESAASKRRIETRFITPKEATALNPLIDPAMIESVWFNPHGGRLNPADLCAAYAKGARAAGAEVIEGRAVTGLSERSGRIVGVHTADGPVDADHVIVACGLWSRRLLLDAGVALAQWPCEHFYVIAEVEPRLKREIPSFVSPDHNIYGREEVGGFLVGVFDDDAKTLDPAALPEPFAFSLFEPAWEKSEPYLRNAMELFPVLRTAPIRKFINGPETFTPDGLPLVGPVTGKPGLLVATAMNSVGVTWSFALGHAVSDLIAGSPPRFDLSTYTPDRFGAKAADESWLKTQASDAVGASYRNANQ